MSGHDELRAFDQKHRADDTSRDLPDRAEIADWIGDWPPDAPVPYWPTNPSKGTTDVH